MSNNKTGGPAFPHDGIDLCEPNTAGMTMRDYFAAKAMQGLLANHEWNLDDETVSRMAYTVADAMLKARNT